MDTYLILKTALILVSVDAIYITMIQTAFGKMIKSIQNEPMKLKWGGAIACYAALVTLMYKFIIVPGKSTMDAFIMGGCVYAVYDATNYATLAKWDPMIAIMDTLWGGTLFAITQRLVTY
jgi:uncharacterized membrane protein